MFHAGGIKLFAAGKYPEGLSVSKAFKKLQAFLIAHAEKRSGKAVRRTAVGCDDRDRVKIFCGEKGVRVYYVVIFFAVNDIETLIAAGGDTGRVGNEDIQRKSIGILGVFDN